MAYTVPSNLLSSLRSDAGQQALGAMFEARLRELHTALEKAVELHHVYALQGRIAEIRDLQKSLAK